MASTNGDIDRVPELEPFLNNAPQSPTLPPRSPSAFDDSPSRKPSLQRKRSRADSMLQSGRNLVRQPSVGAWKYKYEHYMADQPSLDDHAFGAGKREFYRRQREMLEGFKQCDELATTPSFSEEERRQLERTEWGERLAVQLSNSINVVLLVAKVVAVSFSGSLAIVASALDSLLDLLAGGILWYTSRSMMTNQPDKYPVGKKRMQPVGIIIFAAIMATLGLQVILEGVQELVKGENSDAKLSARQLLWVVGIIGGVIVAKLLLFLFCRMFENDIVQAYAMDHFFDVLTNMVGLTAVLLATWVWWLDPAGAIVIALYTTANWGRTVLDNAASLVGTAAPPEFIGKLTYLVFNHDKLIKRIDTVRAWSYGNLFLVEVDIELPEDMPLRDAHDIGESLQNKIESLPEVERAYVHLDHASSERREHTGSYTPPP